jgi:hypothetical protein
MTEPLPADTIFKKLAEKKTRLDEGRRRQMESF